MKKTLLLFLFLLPVLGFSQTRLSGDYVISAANSDVNFKTLAAAVARLNAIGIDNDVQFLIDENQNLSSQLTITHFQNPNSKKITIKPNTSKDISISGNVGNGAVLAFNDADNVILDGNNTIANNRLKIYNTFNDTNNSYTNRCALLLYNGSDNNFIQNLNIELNIVGIDVGTISTGIMAGGSSLNTDGNNPNNTIQNVTFTKVKQAIIIRGQNASNSDWKILNNQITSTDNNTKAFLGIYLLNASNYNISGNTVNGIRLPSNLGGSTNHSGIYVENANTGTISKNTVSNVESQIGNGSGYGIFVKGNTAIISENTVSNLFTTSTNTGAFGIRLEGDNGSIYRNKISSVISNQGKNTAGIYTAGDNQLVYNNFVLDVNSAGGGNASSQDGFGIYINSGSNIKLYHNSVKLITNQSSGSSAALYVRDGSGFDIRNNIFVNAQTSGSTRFAVYFETSDVSKFPNLDYNDYYSSQYLGCFGNYYTAGNRKNTIAEWRTATTKETNSKNENPTFQSSLYLDPNNAVNKTLVGISNATVTTDIDNTARIKPYMGAHELVACVPTGDQTSFGNNSWIGYVYKIADNAALPPNTSYPNLPSAAIATYIGTVTESKNFDRNVGNGAVAGATTNIPCDTAPTDRFLVRYKMRVDITEAGVYSFDLGSDDGIRLYIDNAPAPVVTRWNGHGYTTDYYTQNLSVGSHNFVLEYYEDGGASRVSFYTGLPKGNPSEYGDKVWNVYGYVNNDITLSNVRYAGYYVDPNLNPYSTSYWTRDKSPSSATIWQGASIPDNNFTVVFKRKGFDCGRYLLQHNNHDDAIEIYIDNVRIFAADGWNNASFPINNGTLYALNSNSLVEIRLREDGGDANVGINFVKTNVAYTNGAGNESGSNLLVNSNTTLSSDLTVCSCTVNPNFTLTVPKDRTLTVDETITVGTGGKLLIQDGGSLLQTSTSTTMFTGNATAFEIQRNSSMRRYDATYWSMPVTKAGFSMHDFSPNTLSDKYLYFDSTTGKWAVDPNGATPMKTGIGYSIRAPQTHSVENKEVFTGIFNGVPNNGNIPVTTESGKWYLIGNPYPSAINANTFLTNNTGVGAIYLWAHQNLPVLGAGGMYYYTDDFIVYNSLGSNGAFSGYIGAAQGFMVKASASAINFNNGQRVKGNNSDFKKTAALDDIERHRIWLNLKNDSGLSKQILLGYATGATNTTDADFDALTMGSTTEFYSINNAKKLTIQGRALPFDKSDSVPLGYKLAAEGTYTITIDQADGLFNEGQDVFLEDLTAGVVTNLRTSDYTFTSAAGSFNKRFVISYTNKTLGTGDFENVENGVLVSIKSKIININSAVENISEVQIYNVGGQSLYTKNKIESKDLQISNLQSSNQVLLVKVILENGAIVTKKIIFN